MSEIDFILDEIRFSYSSLSSFRTCPYSFKLTYIDKAERVGNFYGEFGSLTHKIFEKYFSGELEAYELSSYFEENFDTSIVSGPPSYPAGIVEKYKAAGMLFFDNFSFKKDDYEVISIEEELKGEVRGIKFIGKPDLILREKKTNNIYLFDYKSSAPFWIDKRTGKEREDTQKLAGYYTQMYLYVHMLRLVKGIDVSKITLWFTRPHRQVTVECNKQNEEDALNWLEETVNLIKSSDDFPYNNGSKYFCDNICGVRLSCEYRD